MSELKSTVDVVEPSDRPLKSKNEIDEKIEEFKNAKLAFEADLLDWMRGGDFGDYYYRWAQEIHRETCISFNTVRCGCELVKTVALKLNFKRVEPFRFRNILWKDYASQDLDEKLKEIRAFYNNIEKYGSNNILRKSLPPPFMRINQFPSMQELTNKANLAKNLKRMNCLFPGSYEFAPNTWIYPSDKASVTEYWESHKKVIFICKPADKTHGKGIFLCKNPHRIRESDNVKIIQEYIRKPYILDEYKFDLRIYVLITCLDPLHIYIYDDGLARFSTKRYEKPNYNENESRNANKLMHLTNYSMQKSSPNFDPFKTKRRLYEIFLILKKEGHDPSLILAEIDDLVVKTVIAAYPNLIHSYRVAFPKKSHPSACFQLLGFDILLDCNLRPFLLEVNSSPSLNTDCPADEKVKSKMVKQILESVAFWNFKPNSNETGDDEDHFNSSNCYINYLEKPIENIQLKQFQHEFKILKNFRLVYPNQNFNLYSPYFVHKNSSN